MRRVPNREINGPASQRLHLLASRGLFSFCLYLNGRDAHLQLASVAVDGSAMHLTGARLGNPWIWIGVIFTVLGEKKK